MASIGNKTHAMFSPIKIRSCANERERGRTQSVNGAFMNLRELIPTEPVDRKLSKIETLRLATSYIEHLATQLKQDPRSKSGCIIRQQHSPAPTLYSSKWNYRRSYMGQTETNSTAHIENHRRTICTFCLSELRKSNSLPDIERSNK